MIPTRYISIVSIGVFILVLAGLLVFIYRNRNYLRLSRQTQPSQSAQSLLVPTLSPTPKPPYVKPVDWLTYSDKDNGYTIDYPPIYTTKRVTNLSRCDELISFIDKQMKIPMTEVCSGSDPLKGIAYPDHPVVQTDIDGNVKQVYLFDRKNGKKLVLYGNLFLRKYPEYQGGETVEHMVDSLKIQ